MVTLGRQANRTINGYDVAQCLTPRDVPQLRIGWNNRYEPHEVVEILESFPGRSVWLPSSGEFVLIAPWRHRTDIAHITELSAPRSSSMLIDAAIERSSATGATIIAMIENDEKRRPSFYERAGLSFLEEVVTYELEFPSKHLPEPSPIRWSRLAIGDPRMIQAIAIDNAAFPWLWWNTVDEFDLYLRIPDVEVFIGTIDEIPVAYVGLTLYHDWGHLDRVAVDPRFQGRRYGYHSVNFATTYLARNGASRIGLSTQGDNMRSRQLYERLGFSRNNMNDYRIYGRWLRSINS